MNKTFLAIQDTHSTRNVILYRPLKTTAKTKTRKANVRIARLFVDEKKTKSKKPTSNSEPGSTMVTSSSLSSSRIKCAYAQHCLYTISKGNRTTETYEITISEELLDTYCSARVHNPFGCFTTTVPAFVLYATCGHGRYRQFEISRLVLETTWRSIHTLPTPADVYSYSNSNNYYYYHHRYYYYKLSTFIRSAFAERSEWARLIYLDC